MGGNKISRTCQDYHLRSVMLPRPLNLKLVCRPAYNFKLEFRECARPRNPSADKPCAVKSYSGNLTSTTGQGTPWTFRMPVCR